MAHFFLHGGFRGLAQPEAVWADFLQAWMPVAGPVLLLPWALPAKRAEAQRRMLVRRLKKLGHEVEVFVATTPDEAKALWPNVRHVFAPGGILLAPMVDGFAQLRGQVPLDGCRIAGYSAGVYGLSTWYYDSRRRQAKAGGGWLPIAVCCHYGLVRAGAEGCLHEKKLPVHLLADGQFVEIKNP